MKPIILACALAFAACSDPAPTPAAAPPAPAPPEYASTWYSAGSDAKGAVFNIHATRYGFGGFLRRNGEDGAYPIRVIHFSEGELGFVIPHINAAFLARKDADGVWVGEWTEGGKREAMPLAAIEMPAAATDNFVKFTDGRWMQYVCAGAGSPAILPDYGAGSSLDSWQQVFEPLSKVSRTCMFERAGFGLSDPAPLPRDVNAVVSDIEAFLTAAKIETPIVLVGHSLASYHVRQFANLHRDQTAGLVLVDPSGDGQDARFIAAIPNIYELIPDQTVTEEQVKACSIGMRQIVHSIATSQTPDDMDPIFGKCGGKDPDRAEAVLSEIASMEVVSTGQIKAAAKPYGELPLIVLTRGDYQKGMPPGFTPEATAKLKDVWTSMHAEMAAQSAIGQTRTIEGAGHGIQRDKPQAVIDAVTEVVTKARAGMTQQ
ncbi:MAG: alpha/beta hydrolase [Hyphomonadaceae bacterium]|nr:alpha/beta hydrolase [Hyphomonadaceae bacterium]